MKKFPQERITLPQGDTEMPRIEQNCVLQQIPARRSNDVRLRQQRNFRPMQCRCSSEEGFTLIELMVVMIIIATLAAMAVPAYTHHIRMAKEAVLRQDLQVMRQAIDSYTVDKQKAPESLDELVQAGYLKVLPRDPITNSDQTWTADRSDTYASVDQMETGINDVHSGSGLASTDGSSYSTW